MYVIVEVGGIFVVINLLILDEFEFYFRCVIILYDVVKCENKDVIVKYVSIVL